jgi:hypothetical protein
MSSRAFKSVLCCLLTMLGLAGNAGAKRPVQSNDTIPPPPPAELLNLTAHQFTVPRQTVSYPEELAHYLNGCPPVEVWFRIQFQVGTRRKDTVVYSSRPNLDIEKVATRLMAATIVQAPPDSGTSENFWFHRMVMVAPGKLIKTDPNAIPVPLDLPTPEVATDSGYVPAKLLEKGKLDVSHLVIKPGLSGMVILKVRVGTDGIVKLVRVVSTSGEIAVDNLGMEIAYRNKYKPATKKGEPVEAEVLDDFAYRVHK